MHLNQDVVLMLNDVYYLIYIGDDHHYEIVLSNYNLILFHIHLKNKL